MLGGVPTASNLSPNRKYVMSFEIKKDGMYRDSMEFRSLPCATILLVRRGRFDYISYRDIEIVGPIIRIHDRKSLTPRPNPYKEMPVKKRGPGEG